MMRSIIVLSLALLLVACKHEKEYSGNPIVEGWYADPEGVVFDDEYWIYPTCPIFLSEPIAQIFPN